MMQVVLGHSPNGLGNSDFVAMLCKNALSYNRIYYLQIRAMDLININDTTHRKEGVHMDKIIFDNKVRDIAEKRPRLFALHSDNMASTAMIKDVEEYYNLKFPDSYKEYLKQYGGGYFGYIIVYSCDYNGMFYIKNNVAKELVLERAFLPIIDLETGDFIGFKIVGGKCQNTVAMFLHEENELQDLRIDFYDALLEYGLSCS